MVASARSNVRRTALLVVIAAVAAALAGGTTPTPAASVSARVIVAATPTPALPATSTATDPDPALALRARAALPHDPASAQLYALTALERSRTPDAVEAAAAALAVPLLPPGRELTGEPIWSPDGRRMAVPASPGWTVTDPEGNHPVPLAPTPGSQLPALTWSPDGRRAVTESVTGAVTLYDAGSGAVLKRLPGKPDASEEPDDVAPLAVAWSPDGTWLATTLYEELQVWDTRTWQVVQAQPHGVDVKHVTSPVTLQWATDSRRVLTATADGAVRVWGADGRLVDEWTGPAATTQSPNGLVQVAWSPDGRQIAAVPWSPEGTVLVHTVGTTTAPLVLDDHFGQVEDLTWRPDGGALATASDDGTVQVWDVGSAHVTQRLTGHDGGAVAVAWRPDGSLLATAAADGGVRLWSDGELVATSAATRVLTGPARVGYRATARLAWSPDGTRLISDDTVRAVAPPGGLASPAPPWTEQARQGPYGGRTAWSADLTHVATATDERLRIWATGTARTTATVQLPPSGTNASRPVAWSPDGTRLAVATDGGTLVLDPAGHVLARHGTASVTTIAWAPDSRRVATRSDDSVEVWDSRDGRLLTTLPTGAARDGGEPLAWSPDGRRLAATTDASDAPDQQPAPHTVRVYDSRTAAVVQRFDAGQPVLALGFAPDGDRLLVGSADATITVRDAARGTVLSTQRAFVGDRADVPTSSVGLALAWAPAGSLVATASTLGVVRVWDASDGRVVAAWHETAAPDVTVPRDVHDITWSRDGRRLVVVLDGYVSHVYPAPADWSSALCARAGRNLSLAQWVDPFPTTPYRRLCPQWPAGE